MFPSQNITDLLINWNEGDRHALDELFPLVEHELKRIARGRRWRAAPDESLQTTIIINETYLRLVDQNRVRWQNRAHFFAIAAEIMRRILLNYIRERNCVKRGGKLRRTTLGEAMLVTTEKSAELLALDAALDRLGKTDRRKSRIVELKYFGGLNNAEIAAVLGISQMTVTRDWKLAKAWLAREIRDE